MLTLSKPDTVEQVVSEHSNLEITKDKSTVRFEEKAVDTEITLWSSFKMARSEIVLWSTCALFEMPSWLRMLGSCCGHGEVWKFCKILGPGTIITLAYINLANFQTAVSSRAQFKYKLLFVVLISNPIAIYLQASNKPQAVSVREVPNYCRLWLSNSDQSPEWIWHR